MSQPSSTGPSTDPTSPPRRFPTTSIVTCVAVVVSGLSLATYALVGFAVPDWTIAAPSLAVAVLAPLGLRWRAAFLVGLVPISALVTVGAPVVAFDLNRPGETSYFLGTVIIVVSACFAAVLSIAVLLPRTRWVLPAALGLGAAASVVVMATTLSGQPASRPADEGVTVADRAAATELEMIDYAFVADDGGLPAGGTLHVRNTGELPHDLNIAELDIDVFVPSGRSTYVRLPDARPGDRTLICTVGEHASLGMVTTIRVG